MEENKKIVDGCTAAAYVAYAMSEVATVYPITPIAEMGETAQKWGISGIKNFEGNVLDVREMESELGAAGATHGALAAGALATTFTSSQGLMLMVPNMFKIAGELLPGVFHVGCRSVATHALSIFGDHSDVMACRTTGFSILMSANVQETQDLGLVAHLSAIEGRVPVLHAFDGWRTSNEMETISMIPYKDMFSLINRQKVAEFRARAMNPEHPDLRGSAQNADVYFQNREASNPFYDAFPALVQAKMDAVAALTGRSYHLFDYVGAPDADRVIISMGSSCQVVEQTVEALNKAGYKVGAVKVRLFRPFAADKLIEAIPLSVKKIAVLDRTKEPGGNGEPLFVDVATAVLESGRPIKVIGGRYGLSSKEFDPTMVKAVFDELAKDEPLRRFTVGINDDVTRLSLDLGEPLLLKSDKSFEAIFYGIGADGTVGATKQAAAVIGDTGGLYAQAYFSYSAKKSGGYTVSELRVSPEPILSEYGIEEADYVGCNKDTYVKRFELLKNIRTGGIFVLASAWTLDDMNRIFPAALKRAIAAKKVKFYNVDAHAIAARHNLGVRINMIMETVFLKLSAVVPFDTAFDALQERIKTTYIHEGGQVVADNLAAVGEAVAAIVPVEYPSEWADAVDTPSPQQMLPDFVKNVAQPCLRREGNSLPVSLMSADGRMPAGTTAYEKRRIALKVPRWDPAKCVECTECSLVCAHASIRPFLLDAAEMKDAPADLLTLQATSKPIADYRYRIQVYPEDCTGCGSCAVICPGQALSMQPMPAEVDAQVPLLDYIQQNVTYKPDIVNRFTINGSQFCQPLLEFSGACAGCGETPYIKLITQLFGERMIIANATGCSSIWGGDFPSNPYTKTVRGRGPAWGNSLFEDNAEYGFGMAVAVDYRRKVLRQAVEALSADTSASQAVRDACNEWLAVADDPQKSDASGAALINAIGTNPDSALAKTIVGAADLLGKKSVWSIGGDGWAYDIGFAGLDHVLAQNVDINLFVMDTECYSNTGGQMSKATPLSAVAKYAADGKRTFKKDLGRMMMTYGNIYVASICLGADYQQAITALKEAEAYPGPSIVIAYCPCINHGIRIGMGHDIIEERNAVKSGYWPLYRYNPALSEPLTVDYQAPDGQLIDFINGEDRYADLKMIDATEAAVLQPELAKRCDSLFAMLNAETKLPPL